MEEPWVKLVHNRPYLIPTLALVRDLAEVNRSAEGADVSAIRKSLAEQFGTYSTCPVTVRRHLKTLGISARRPAGQA